MEELKNIISKNLIELRKHHKLTQGELAIHMNYSDKSVSKWETGETTPSVEILKKLADFYGIKIDGILDENFKIEKDTNKKQKVYSKLFISLLGVVSVWLFTVTLFVLVNVSKEPFPHPWMLFIYATPVSFVTAFIFNVMWGKRIVSYLLISAGIWTTLLALFLTSIIYINVNMWMVFLIGIPIQVMIILILGLKKVK